MGVLESPPVTPPSSVPIVPTTIGLLVSPANPGWGSQRSNSRYAGSSRRCPLDPAGRPRPREGWKYDDVAHVPKLGLNGDQLALSPGGARPQLLASLVDELARPHQGDDREDDADEAHQTQLHSESMTLGGVADVFPVRHGAPTQVRRMIPELISTGFAPLRSEIVPLGALNEMRTRL